MSFTLDAAAELGIPDVLFWTTSAYESYLTNGHLDTIIDWIPGMKGIRLRDLPSFIATTDPDDVMLNFPMVEAERAQRASAVILNTFDALEREVLGLSTIYPSICSIGPLQLLVNQIPDNSYKLIGSNLWKEEAGCIEWLDKREPNSVVYVNFGSILVMTSNQLIGD
nr:7-deoxyloganetin glucosyltransferase [Quercus suber]